MYPYDEKGLNINISHTFQDQPIHITNPSRSSILTRQIKVLCLALVASHGLDARNKKHSNTSFKDYSTPSNLSDTKKFTALFAIV